MPMATGYRYRWARDVVDEVLGDLAAEHHGVFLTEEALACGVSRPALTRRRASGLLVRLRPRAWLVAPLLDRFSHLAATCLAYP